jgi:hypothetical protein
VSWEEDLSITSTEEAAAPGMTPQPWPDRSKPFPPGNAVALVSGYRSPARVGARAEQIERDLLEDPSVPEYVKDPSYAGARQAYARAAAVAALLWDWMDAQDPEALLAAITTTDEDEQRKRGRTTKRTVSHRMESTFSQWDKAASRAANLYARLGMDPMSRARLGKDITAAKFDLAQMLAQLAKTEPGHDGH